MEALKTCPNCHVDVDNHFDLCWNCNYSFSEEKVVKIAEANELKKDISCLRCHIPMHYSGNYKFHEGTRIGALAAFMEIFTNREAFDLYTCPRCGKVEFFVP